MYRIDHDILWDLGYPHEWEDPAIRQELLYREAVPQVASIYGWRDLRVMDKCHWYW